MKMRIIVNRKASALMDVVLKCKEPLRLMSALSRAQTMLIHPLQHHVTIITRRPRDAENNSSKGAVVLVIVMLVFSGSLLAS